MKKFTEWLEEEKKKKSKKEPSQPTPTSSPLRGANQDYSGVNVKNDSADYTISDETIVELVAGVGSVHRTPVGIRVSSHTGGSNAPQQAARMQKAATMRARELDKFARDQQQHEVDRREKEIEKRRQAERQRQQKQRPVGGTAIEVGKRSV